MVLQDVSQVIPSQQFSCGHAQSAKQPIKGCISGRKHSERPGSLQGIHQSCSLECFHKHGEAAIADCSLHNVWDRWQEYCVDDVDHAVAAIYVSGAHTCTACHHRVAVL